MPHDLHIFTTEHIVPRYVLEEASLYDPEDLLAYDGGVWFYQLPSWIRDCFSSGRAAVCRNRKLFGTAKS